MGSNILDAIVTKRTVLPGMTTRQIVTNDLKDPLFSNFTPFRHKKFITRNQAAAELIDSAGGLPQKDCMLAIKTNGQSDTGGFFTTVLDKCGCIFELYLASWIISRENVNRLLDAVDSRKLVKLNFLLSTRMQKISSKSVYAKMITEFSKRSESVCMRTAKSHCKTFSVTNGVDYITVSGSGNWTENPRIEDYLIINSEGLYQHHKKWMDEFLYE